MRAETIGKLASVSKRYAKYLGYNLFFDYSGHVDWISIRIEGKDLTYFKARLCNETQAQALVKFFEHSQPLKGK